MDFITLTEWVDRAEQLVNHWYGRIRDAKSDKRWKADEGEEVYYDGKIDAFEECIQDLERWISDFYETLYVMERDLAPMVQEDDE